MPARAQLEALDLSTLHVALDGDSIDVGDNRKPPQPALTQVYPSLKRKPKEYLATLSVRIYPEQDQALDDICAEYRIDKSSLVRDMLRAGIQAIQNAQLQQP